MTHDVFLSYSSKDRAAADAICDALEAAQIRVWTAPRDILPGVGWAQSIIGAINGARVMVLVFSSNANGSPQIEREVERAAHKGVAILPVRIEDVAPSEALEYFISAPHWLDAFPPPSEPYFARLAEDVKRLLESPFVRRGSEAPSPAEAKRAEEEAAEAARRMEEGHRRRERAEAAERKLAEAEAARGALEERLLQAERQVKEAAARMEEDHREQAEKAERRLAEAEVTRRRLEERLRQAEAARDNAEGLLRQAQIEAAKPADAQEERPWPDTAEAPAALPSERMAQRFPSNEPEAPAAPPPQSEKPKPPNILQSKPAVGTLLPAIESKMATDGIEKNTSDGTRVKPSTGYGDPSSVLGAVVAWLLIVLISAGVQHFIYGTAWNETWAANSWPINLFVEKPASKLVPGYEPLNPAFKNLPGNEPLNPASKNLSGDEPLNPLTPHRPETKN